MTKTRTEGLPQRDRLSFRRHIEVPSPNKVDDESLARLLMECGFCQRREVIYLNELELKSFESRKCIARICKICDAPSIWAEAQSELTASGSATSIRIALRPR